MSGPGRDPVPLRSGLEQFLKHFGAPPVDVVADLTRRWEDVVGPALSGPTRPLELRAGHLVVACDDPAWAAQIGWMEAQIIERFGRVFPDETLSRVSARVVV